MNSLSYIYAWTYFVIFDLLDFFIGFLKWELRYQKLGDILDSYRIRFSCRLVYFRGLCFHFLPVHDWLLVILDLQSITTKQILLEVSRPSQKNKNWKKTLNKTHSSYSFKELVPLWVGHSDNIAHGFTGSNHLAYPLPTPSCLRHHGLLGSVLVEQDNSLNDTDILALDRVSQRCREQEAGPRWLIGPCWDPLFRFFNRTSSNWGTASTTATAVRHNKYLASHATAGHLVSDSRGAATALARVPQRSQLEL